VPLTRNGKGVHLLSCLLSIIRCHPQNETGDSVGVSDRRAFDEDSHGATNLSDDHNYETTPRPRWPPTTKLQDARSLGLFQILLIWIFQGKLTCGRQNLLGVQRLKDVLTGTITEILVDA
jgi:hypothetical protein